MQQVLFGIQTGDEVIKINGKKIRTHADFEKALSQSQGEPITVLLKRGQQEIEKEVTPTSIPYKSTGIYFGVADENISTKVIALYSKSPAEQADIRVGDRITKVNGVEVTNDPYAAAQQIEASEGIITFTIERNGEFLERKVEPQVLYEYKLGVTFQKAENHLLTNLYYGFWDTTDFAFSIIDNLKTLFSGKVSVNQLMGPIGISDIVAKTNGIADFVNILALISLSLGVTNLLPFPPLDGGKVVILILEAIRRKPLKENIEVGIQMLGFLLLILLSIYVTYHDIIRIF